MTPHTEESTAYYEFSGSKAKAGHVTGGRVFGYDNVEILGPPDAQGRQKRSHVERCINDDAAAVVRRIWSSRPPLSERLALPQYLRWQDG